jgi:isoamylase
LEPESKRSVALRRAIEGFRQMAERPIPVAAPESGPETERELADAPGMTRP